jgi:DNA-binding LacI/PurR family transcriptional regulator
MVKRRISLKDIANELGVSISTVSRGLRDHPDISDDMIAKIKELAGLRHYSPNPMAMGLLKQRTRMIGVIVPDLVTHFFSSVISGIEEVAKEHGYFVIISSSYESYQKEKENIENLMKARVEGFIICLSQETTDYSHFEQIIESEIPLVFFDRVCLKDKVPTVTADSFEAARRITCHFFENNAHRIAYISGPEQLSISDERKSGYLMGLLDCGLAFRPEYLEKCNLSTESAAMATKRLLSLPNPPDAIFGINDTVVFAAMKEIRKFGLRVPKDILLVGFTDEFHATVVEPTLTSVMHPTNEMGRVAAGLFFELTENVGLLPKSVELKTTLVIRESSVRIREMI